MRTIRQRAKSVPSLPDEVGATTFGRAAQALAMTIIGMLAFGTTAAAEPAHAAPVSGVSWNLLSDGSAPFDATAGDGFDTGLNNGIVRAQDTVTWELSTVNIEAGTSRYVLTLPLGMQWTAASAAGTVCTGQGAGSVSANGAVLTCNRTVDSPGVSMFAVSARVGSIANAAQVAPTAAVDGLTVSGPAVTVSATPKTALTVLRQGTLSNQVYGGQTGIVEGLYAYLGGKLDPANPNFYGFEALANVITFKVKVPAGAVMMAPAVALGQGGVVTATQDGGPGTPIQVTATGATTNFLNPITNLGTPTDIRALVAFKISFFTPYEGYFERGVTVNRQAQVVDFDPLSLSHASNFGDGVAPGQEAGKTCAPIESGTNLSCYGYDYVRPSGAVVWATTTATMNGAQTQIMYGDYHGMSYGTEPVLPGQKFSILDGIYNSDGAESPTQNAYGSLTWNSSQIQLAGIPRLKLITNKSGADAFYIPSQVTAAQTVNPSEYTLEYTNFAFANDADRKSRESFVDSAMTWVTDPNLLAGGMASVTSIRVKYLTALPPNATIGLVTPMMRSLSSAGVAAGTRLPWFWQFGSDDRAVVKSTYAGTGNGVGGSGTVQAFDSLIRANFEWLRVEGAPYAAGNAERGDVVNLKVTPVVLGPVGSLDTIARDTKLTVTLPNACVEPVAAALPANVDTFTPGVPGASCSAGTPAKLTFRLGDLAAPGGDAGPAPYEGHATLKEAIQFPVKISMETPLPMIASANLTVESTSDGSVADYSGYAQKTTLALSQDKTFDAPLTISGAATFKSSKSATTVRPGFVGPGESVKYTIAWANASTQRFTDAHFVDLFPFDGDLRGSTGFNGSGTVLKSVISSMDAPGQGNVLIEYSRDDPTEIETALHVSGNEGGTSGIHWEELGDNIPAGVTALRFTPEDGMKPGFAGGATIDLAAPAMAVAGALNNNVSMRLTAESGSDIFSSAGASRPLQSSAALIHGNVYRDLDFSGTVTDADADWPAKTASIELRSGSTVVKTSDVAADGSYAFPLVPAGEYEVALKSSANEGWEQVLPGVLEIEPSSTNEVEVLYQEPVAAPILVDDYAKVSFGETVDADVTHNDTIAFPQFENSVFAEDGVAIASTPSNGGSVVLKQVAGSQSMLTYTPSATWPASAAGETSYTDSVGYSWTNAQGEAETATLNVLVIAQPVAEADTATIHDGSASIDVLANDVGDELELGSPPTVPAGTDASVTYEGGKLMVTPTHMWGATETSLDVPVTYSVVDSQGKTSSAVATVTIQRAPVATATTDRGTIGLSGSVSVNPAVLNQSALAATDAVTVQTPPAKGILTVAADGTATYTADAEASGAYSFTLLIRDTLGQRTTATYTVNVQARPVATGASATIGMGESYDFAASVISTGTLAALSIQTAPAQGLVEVAGQTIRFSAGEAEPGSYAFVVLVADNLGQTTTATYTVTVQAAPVVTGIKSATIAQGTSTTFNPAVVTTGGLDRVVLSTAPTGGTVTVNQATGAVTFNSGSAAAGDYPFTVTYTDNVGQSVQRGFTVTVQSALTATGGSATIGEGQTFTFPDSVSTSGTVASQTLTTLPSLGTAVLVPGGVRYTADSTPGVYGFVVEYADNLGQTATATYSVIVQAKPTITGASAHIGLGAVKRFTPIVATTGTITDAFVSANPANGTATIDNGEVVFDSVDAVAGTYSFEVTFTDNVGQLATATYLVTIHNPLFVTGEFSATIAQGASVSFAPEFADVSAYSGATVSILPESGTASVSDLTRLVTFSAAGIQAGIYPFTISYTDSYGQITPVEFTVTVLAQPTATDQEATIGLSGEIVFTERVSPAGNIVMVEPRSPIENSGFALESGTVVFTTNGADFAVGTRSLVVRYTDAAGQFVDATYTVHLQGKPIATGASATIGVGASHTFPKNVISASHDLRIEIVQPDEGTVTVASDGAMTYAAGAASAGVHSFSVTYTDEFDQSVTVEYTITVQSGPVINLLTSQTVAERGTAEFIPVIDTAGSLAHVTVESQPSQGELIVDQASGKVVFEAKDAAPGVYSFEVTFTDDLGQGTSVTLTVTVQAKPTVNGDQQKVAEGGSVSFVEQVETSGTIVQREIIQKPADGEAVLGSVIYRAGHAQPGRYEFVVRYTDDLGQTADATYAATVQAAPIAKGRIELTVPFGTERVTIDVVGAVESEYLLPLTASDFSQPSSGAVSLNGEGLPEYTTVAGFVGTASFNTTVVDDLGQSAVVTSTITVEPAVAVTTNHGLAATGFGSDVTVWMLLALLVLIGSGCLLLVIRRHTTTSVRRQ
ncbi:Ig-like domain-containing protein [Lysinibacter cavernae]|uniref:Uncharacterized protein n=1 Tax=Lysinibacter cavernae TaxID=1640652 RepID=A0A7X5TU57_9MICO|nr:Ig-like domain-containing protein [Lysinibacter cavernae]NIH55341.1 hypothetical protein [Lysinibacter cavernae]